MKSTSFEQTKQVLEGVFEREGFPRFIRSDNGPPFNGEDYKKYCSERGIETQYSTPLFPQQNGLVENYMKLVNKAMATAVSNGTCFREALRAAVNAHNAASHSVTGVPPEEVMLGRKIKRRLPLLQHTKANFDEEQFNQRDRLEKLKAKEREDTRRGARSCRVGPGDTVIVERLTRTKGESRFDPQRFTVIQEDNGSLVLQNDQGQTLKRHVTQTKKVIKWRETEIKSNADHNDDHVNEQPPAGPPSRPQRAKLQPTYLRDYVQSLEH